MKNVLRQNFKSTYKLKIHFQKGKKLFSLASYLGGGKGLNVNARGVDGWMSLPTWVQHGAVPRGRMLPIRERRNNTRNFNSILP